MSTAIQFDLSGSQLFTTWDEILNVALAAERLGFYAYHSDDHMLPIAGSDPTRECLEGWTLLPAIAMKTERIRLGVMVTGNTYRHPVMLARVATAVDHISRGRLDFGIGSGWSALDHHPYGISFPPFGQRVEALDEALQIIRMLWTQKLSDFEGKHYKLNKAPLEPKPVQKPHPPILLGGSSEGLLRLTARHANIWNGLGTRAYIAKKMDDLDRLCKEAGRAPGDIQRTVWSEFLLTETEAEAERYVQARAAKIRSLAKGEDPRQKYQLPEEKLEDAVRESFFVGTPRQLQQQVQRYIDIGVRRFILRVPRPFNLKPVERFASGVMPVFR